MKENKQRRLAKVQLQPISLVAMKTSKGLLIFIALLGASVSAQKAEASRGPEAGLFVLASQTVPLSQVLNRINDIEPGTQLDTSLISENGRPYYIVRWQASRGRIIIFKVDAQTGQIVGRQG
jgi:uncharacterized membrane protein YkoI